MRHQVIRNSYPTKPDTSKSARESSRIPERSPSPSTLDLHSLTSDNSSVDGWPCNPGQSSLTNCFCIESVASSDVSSPPRNRHHRQSKSKNMNTKKSQGKYNAHDSKKIQTLAEYGGYERNTSKEITSDEDIDDNEVEDILTRISQRKYRSGQNIVVNIGNERNASPMSSSTLTTPPSMRTTSETSVDGIKAKSAKYKKVNAEVLSEPRIIAPNVGKLTSVSVVELRLCSPGDSVLVQCSVDVLKMRSSYFQSLLGEQEELKPLTVNNTAGWRAPINIDEESPFEAAAFLESLHEGRMLFKGEWNICWARLSVHWGIEDLVLEYAHMIESHTNKILSYIQTSHWRTNPNVLAGMKVAVMRKGPTPVPTIVLGMCVEASQSTAYSKIRVAFDMEKKSPEPVPVMQSPLRITKPTIDMMNMNASTPSTVMLNKPDYPQSPSFTRNLSFQKSSPGHKLSDKQSTSSDMNTMSPSKSIDASMLSSTYPASPPPQLPNHRNAIVKQPDMNPSSAPTSTTASPSQIFVGDIGEPFWVQGMHDGASWIEPDDLFLADAKRSITVTDKRIFWEMIRTLIELPEIAKHCNSSIKGTKDLKAALTRIENRLLWTSDGPDCLPKAVALELLTTAYVIPSNNREK